MGTHTIRVKLAIFNPENNAIFGMVLAVSIKHRNVELTHVNHNSLALYVFIVCCVIFQLYRKMDIKLNRVLTQTSEDNNTVYHTSACPLCKSESLITDTESGEVICSKCGMVISDKIQETKARGFLKFADASNERARTGMPTSLASSDMGLSTVRGCEFIYNTF